MHTLFQFHPSGNCYKLRLAMRQLGVSFRIKEINILKGESRTPEFLAINPNGRVPVLQVGDRYLPESNAALWYLAQQTHLLPDDSFSQAQVLQWMLFEQYSHEPNIATLRYWQSLANIDTSELIQTINTKRQAGYQALEVMERHLAERDYFVGEQYSIADITLYAYTHVAHEGGFDLKGFPGICRWLVAVASQPGFVSLAD
ncbi:glutathione S-transferase family protein [Gilvimarinus xylanilyticus]|uniref:Glutathione S-transferase family protein n=1 Tax=Gilvimarinus xylanilyticus TaxID=2944139 RepID=A0A9X2KUA3_9GAMM|nr:glutathione S-transferase family protein [Gilvimarinus xylanilyticus]MCP8900042.1 glutathione S-transferase family protein [Gilvimarinus xylanilyticus]